MEDQTEFEVEIPEELARVGELFSEQVTRARNEAVSLISELSVRFDCLEPEFEPACTFLPWNDMD